MNYGGSKLWVVVNPHYTRKLLEIMKVVTNLDCPYVMGQKEHFIHPAMLHAWGIKFKMVVQTEGDLLVVTAGSLHFVYNMDFSISK